MPNCTITSVNLENIQIPSMEKINESLSEAKNLSVRYIPLFEDDYLLDFTRAILFSLRYNFDLESMNADPVVTDVMNMIYNRHSFKIFGTKCGEDREVEDEYSLTVVPMNNYAIIIKSSIMEGNSYYRMDYPEVFIDKGLKRMSSICPNCAAGKLEGFTIKDLLSPDICHCEYCGITVKKEFTFIGFTKV